MRMAIPGLRSMKSQSLPYFPREPSLNPNSVNDTDNESTDLRWPLERRSTNMSSSVGAAESPLAIPDLEKSVSSMTDTLY